MSRLLFPTDFSDVSKNALTYCSQFADVLSSDVTVLHAYETNRRLRNLLLPGAQRRSVWGEMESLVKDTFGEIPTNFSLMARKGNLAEQIEKATKTEAFKYVVMGKKHAYIAFRKMLGSKTSRVISQSHAPVFVIPAGARFEGFQNILVVGGAYRNLEAPVQQNILSLSLQFGANLHYINVNSDPVSWGYNQEIINRKNFLIQKSIPESFAVESLVEYIQDHQIDLMVMLTNRRKLFEDLFSYSYKHQCLGRTDVPLLVFHTNYLKWMNSKLEQTPKSHFAPMA